MVTRWTGARAALAGILLLAAEVEAAGVETTDISVKDFTDVHIRTHNGDTHIFSLELADDPQERQTGLMHRKSLPENGGMLFDFQYSQPVSMWMKDTLIALDMLFVASDGEILTIAENARPGSLRRIRSGAEIRGVIEIVGGKTRQAGIRPGDQVIHTVFNNAWLLANPDAPEKPEIPKTSAP